MEQDILYVAEYYIERDIFICKTYSIMHISHKGEIILEDDSIIYESELDKTEDNGTFIICPSFDRKVAVNSVIEYACGRMASSIQMLLAYIEK